MAVLSDAARAKVTAHLIRKAREVLGQDFDFTKVNLRDAINATDSWIEDNQGSFNTALPNPFKTNATLELKTLVFCYVAMRRSGLLRTEDD